MFMHLADLMFGFVRHFSKTVVNVKKTMSTRVKCRSTFVLSVFLKGGNFLILKKIAK